jgi:hypothetical protein
LLLTDIAATVVPPLPPSGPFVLQASHESCLRGMRPL